VQPIRLLRSLLPLILVLFVVAVALTLRSRPPREGLPPSLAKERGARAEGFRFSDLSGGRRRLSVQARVGRVDDKGAFEVEDVQRVEIDREDQSPLVLTASRGSGAGAQGKRVMRLEGGVTLHDDGTGFDLSIPTVEVDQVTGVVRSLGAVTIKGALWNGNASAVVYSLKDLPAEIMGLTVEGVDGARLQAQHAVIPPGSRTMTLEGEVDARQGGLSLQAPVVTLVRSAAGRIESAVAPASVKGTMSPSPSGAGSFTGRNAGATWGADGRVTSFELSGGARVEHTRGSLMADRIEAHADAATSGFVLEATGEVALSGPTKKGLGQVSCAALHARLDAGGNLRDGLATGMVAFQAEGTSGEAAEAGFTSLDASGTVTLRSGPERRARAANARTRIVADTITSDLRGIKTVADGRVESTLLAAPTGKEASATPMFAAGEAVHFVSASFESANSGSRLEFRGDVRGWQGERTLSADEVEMIQEGEILNAIGHVSTRMPRMAGRAASEADFVQVSAERLAYRGVARTAEYSGGVRVRQAEGWLEAPRLLVLLAEGGRGFREVQAADGVRFEYRAPGAEGVPNTATGDGDRAVYDTAQRVLRLFGDKGPATIRNTGPTGGTTVGRVLRYHLDTGGLEVESGERDRATIKTPKS
jgi:lipopolysaccharide export system protein LptA